MRNILLIHENGGVIAAAYPKEARQSGVLWHGRGVDLLNHSTPTPGRVCQRGQLLVEWNGWMKLDVGS